MMRVLMFVPQYPYPVLGGLEKQAHELSKALLAKGVGVRVVSGRVVPGQPDEGCVEGVPVTRIAWSRLRWLRFLRSPWDVLRVLWIRRFDYDVIHLHQYSPVGLYVIVLARLLGKPILTKLPNVGDVGLPGLRRRRFGRIALKILLSSDAIVAMSHESIRELAEAHYPARRVLRTPNGIRFSSLAVPHGRPAGEACRVVFVGRLCAQKGIDVLLAAWKCLCSASTRPVDLLLWGDGPELPSLIAQSDRLGLRSSVHFTGQVEGVAARLREMDIFVLPSYAEGNSNSLLEAMAAGLPIVATAVGGAAMQVGEEGAPFLCQPGDAAALAAALLRLVQDPVLRASTGAAMRRRADDHFDIDRVADCYLQAYRCLAEGRRDDVWTSAHPVLGRADFGAAH